MNRTAVAIGPIIFVVLKVLDIIQWTVFIWVILSWLQFFASQTSFAGATRPRTTSCCS